MDFKDIKKLVELVEDSKISHLSLDENGTKIEIKKEVEQSVQAITIPQTQPLTNPSNPPAVVPSVAPVSDAPQEESSNNNFLEIKAQMVGSFYDSPSPDSPAYVKTGDKIEKGQVVCIIEAMKLFNEIESEISGTIEKVCLENGAAVEFGQTLFLVNP